MGAPVLMVTRAERVLETAMAAPARCGAGRLVCVDGVSAAGKSTLATEIVEEARRRGLTARLLHTDAMLQGWGGLDGLAATVGRLLGPLASGQGAIWRAWNWHRDGWGGEQWEAPLAEGELVVLEGVGSGAGEHAGLVTTLVWMDLDPVEQARRWEVRGDDLTALPRWRRDEQSLHERWSTSARADLVFG